MAGDTVQLGPRVDEQLAEDYRSFVRDKFDGSYKGKLGEAIEEATPTRRRIRPVARRSGSSFASS